MRERIRLLIDQLQGHLWVKPLYAVLLSILGAIAASLADRIPYAGELPRVTVASLETLLEVIAAAMLGIAVFAVGAMVSAYASASSTATPRSLPLVIADDVSQNALSAFLGAFIYSVVALIALQNGYYAEAGHLLLLALTLAVLAFVIANFIIWIDRIARLGRLGSTIDTVERATAAALARRRARPRLGGALARGEPHGLAVYPEVIGYVQRIDIAGLQGLAERYGRHITVAALPGTFATPDRPLAFVSDLYDGRGGRVDSEAVRDAFLIGPDRDFADDPRFGLVVLSEIASRALSPAVNDPGTAIDVIGSLVRLLATWAGAPEGSDRDTQYDRVAVPEMALQDMFDDAFHAIARDGAGMLEVGIRLQKALRTLGCLNDVRMARVAQEHAHLAWRYAEQALRLPEEVERLREVRYTSEPPATVEREP